MFFTPSPIDARPVPTAAIPFLNRCYLYSTPEYSDPTFVWGTEVDMTNLKSFVKDYNQTCSTLLTTTSILVRLTGLALKTHPQFNSRILGHHIYRFRQANVLFPMHRKNAGPVLGLMTNVDQMSYGEIAAQLWRQQHTIVHANGFDQWAERVFSRIPHSVARLMLRGSLWLSNHVHKPMGPIDRSLRGAAVLINHFGFKDAPPMLSYKPSRFASNCFLMNVTLGPTSQRPVVVDGEIVSRPMAALFVRADHRIVDAGELSLFVATLKNLISNPQEFDLIATTPREVSDQPAAPIASSCEV
jgi:hypothetical protein